MYQGINIGKGRIQNRHYFRYSFLLSEIVFYYWSCSTVALNMPHCKSSSKLNNQNVLFWSKFFNLEWTIVSFKFIL